MLNFEKNKERIREISEQGYEFALKNGEMVVCDFLKDCTDCDFEEYGSLCVARKFLWLLEDDGEPSPDRIAGQNEAWELVQKILNPKSDGGFGLRQIEEMFGHADITEVINENTYAEAAEKVKAWEDDKKIKVGDEYMSGKSLCVVTKVNIDNGQNVYVLWDDGSAGKWNIDYFCNTFTRTNRMYPVGNLLKQMRGENNE